MGNKTTMARISSVAGAKKTPGVRFAVKRTPVDDSFNPLFAADFSSLRYDIPLSQPGDSAEREADQKADRVMLKLGPDPMASLAGEGIQCEKETPEETAPEDDEDRQRLQKQMLQGSPPPPDSRHAFDAGPLSGGQPLSPELSDSFGHHFGHDFSRVRIYADARAAEMARAFYARAFTIGEEIVFGAGQFAPTSREGTRLLAHELAHVVQQRKARDSRPIIQRSVLGFLSNIGRTLVKLIT
jgi:hypothetical protein